MLTAKRPNTRSVQTGDGLLVQMNEFNILLMNKPNMFFLQANGLLVITVFWPMEIVQADSLGPRAICEL